MVIYANLYLFWELFKNSLISLYDGYQKRKTEHCSM